MQNKILKKLDDMQRYERELEEMIPEREEYLTNTIKRRACEKTLELLIETMIDISSIIVSEKKLGTPSDEDNIFDLLQKVFPKELTDKLKEMKGFRNIIVHRYGHLDDSKAYQFMTEELDDIGVFIETVNNYIQNT